MKRTYKSDPYTILAKDAYLPLDSHKSQLNSNVCIVGGSGRGKTRHVIKPTAMNLSTSLVISDPNGDLVYELGSMLEENGYKIKVVNLIDLKHSNTYNPLSYVRDELDVLKLVDYLFSNVRPGWDRAPDPFWGATASNLISAIILFVMTELSPEERTLGQVLKLLQMHKVTEHDSDEKSDLDLIFEVLANKKPDHIAVRMYKQFKSAAERTACSILIDSETYLQWFNFAAYDNLTSSDQLDLTNISREKTALFVITSDQDRTKNWLAGILYSQLFDILCNQENPIHVRFVLDDFACTCKIPGFDDKIAMIRRKNLSAMIAIQDEAQLEKEYGVAAQGIISNCDSYIFLGSTNIDSCEIAAHRLSQKGITGASVRKMDTANCLVISGNKGGIFAKYPIEKHPRYAEIAEDKLSDRRYDLHGKHRIPVKETATYAEEAGNDCSPDFGVRDSFFDSKEEAYLSHILKLIVNLEIHIHQHLRDIFTTENVKLSKKFSAMHCDFVIRDHEHRVLFGIELDGCQHLVDERQQANDLLKDAVFSSANIPLLRVSAYDVRNNIDTVVLKILHAASMFQGATESPSHDIPSFYEWVYQREPVVLTLDQAEIDTEHDQIDLDDPDNTIDLELLEEAIRKMEEALEDKN